MQKRKFTTVRVVCIEDLKFSTSRELTDLEFIIMSIDRVYQNKWHIQVWFKFCIQKLSQTVRCWCWHLSQEFWGVAETRSVWCKPPEFEIHENLIKCGTIQFLHLLEKNSQTSI
jgi:hypothetical protein